MSGSRTLIVNADDLGRSPGINRGVIEAHRSGIVTSTTLMVNTPWAKDGATQAVAHPELGIGLHLNHCYGNPISDPATIASLVTSDGAFETDTEKLIGKAVEDHIKRESIAQITEFRRLVGRDPSHLDSHKYLQSSEPFAAAIAAVAADFGLPVRALDAGEMGRLRDAGVRTTDHFEGRFHGLDGRGTELSLLVELIDGLRPGVTELMCHPGYVDDELSDSSYRDDREAEMRVLCSPAVRRTVEQARVELSNFDALGEG